MLRRITGLCALALIASLLWGGDLAAPTAAKIIRVILQAGGMPKVACVDKELVRELTALGVAIDPGAKAVWATTEKDVTRLAALHLLVLCPEPGWLDNGAAIALTAEGGRPSIYLDSKHLASAGVTLPDSIIKIAKVR